MKILYRWVITICIVCIAQTSIAEVVLLTDDKTATLDLTSKEGTAVDLLECGIYVLEENGNAYLVHSKGRLPVPKLAMKRMMDSGKVEVDTSGKLLGLKLVSMLLPYSRESTKFSSPYKFIDNISQSRRGRPIFEDGGMVFFVAERESKVAAMLKKIPGTRFVSSKELDNDNVVILLNPSYLEVVGGFPLSDFFLSEWLRTTPLTQVDYNCGVKIDPRSNPYFKK